MFVHFAPAKLEAAILRSGLKPGRSLFNPREKSASPIHAFPVLQSYTLTHQWAREVLKWRRQPLIGIYFRIDDNEEVLLSHLSGPLIKARAVLVYTMLRRRENPLGFEVLIDRKIEPKEIHRIAPVRGVVGWRHVPGAHERRPCGCPSCIMRGEPGGGALRARYESGDL